MAPRFRSLARILRVEVERLDRRDLGPEEGAPDQAGDVVMQSRFAQRSDQLLALQDSLPFPHDGLRGSTSGGTRRRLHDLDGRGDRVSLDRRAFLAGTA